MVSSYAGWRPAGTCSDGWTDDGERERNDDATRRDDGNGDADDGTVTGGFPARRLPLDLADL
jgi:hypothetical protein